MSRPGAGTHLHAIIKKYTGDDYSPTCNCRALVKQMNKHPPQWSLDNMQKVVREMRSEATRRHWWAKFALALPGTTAPLRWMVREAVKLALADITSGQ